MKRRIAGMMVAGALMLGIAAAVVLRSPTAAEPGLLGMDTQVQQATDVVQ